MKDALYKYHNVGSKIKRDISGLVGPSEDGTIAHSQSVVPKALFRNTRGYVERISNQINGTYEMGWFDACAVMIRRLVETLIIEVFENHNISSRIKNPNSDFLYLNDLIDFTLSEQSWNLSRNTKSSLRKLKSIGDKSAHSRRFNASTWRPLRY